MGLLVLSLVFILTIAIGAAMARGILGLVLRVVTEGNLPAAGSVRTAAFIGALITFWSLAPAIAESPAASGLMTLVR